ncbi:Diaminopimelate epimerase-like protein [Stereum hirsutum FP-91666 SS1]|uniref:Diaminopimelate epimerase-like protein n=1 Tax=Stereum hirsutum (strain FP-91666) TaxID=721885 RepID=UPI00044492CB|nr:Diaminopimelate epimerase-like protein [Stereum hirsutum FP-91666 SS1]EIM82838.1 Diaminopimelate epimerase-like protein [Stereum hirsutum FP-91666 SS1]
MPDFTPTQSLKFTTLDVFTSKPFTGNPLAVVTLPSQSAISHEQKQFIAREFNYSETVFVSASTTSANTQGTDTDATATKPEYDVAIFTTDAEIPFAGHPTIGTSHFLLSQAAHATEAILNVKAGPIHARYDPQTGFASARIPQAFHVHAQALAASALLRNQVSLAPYLKDIKETKTYPVVSIVKGMTFVLVDLASLEELEAVTLACTPIPEIQLDTHDGWDKSLVGLYFYVLQSQPSDSSQAHKFKLRTRMIEPELGVEDPATGSAASTLACYLATREQERGSGGARYAFEMVQGVEMGRRSEIGLEVEVGKEGDVTEVVLSGTAVAVSEGTLRV